MRGVWDLDAGIGIRLVTVALLTRDAGDLFDRVLRGIATQAVDCPVELLAIDSGSTDGTVARLREAGARIVRIAPEDFNFGTTRDLAYEHARGDVIVNLSQDAAPAHADWLARLIAPLSDPSIAVSCGASIPDVERGTPQFPWERNGYFYFTREMRRFRKKHGRGVSFANSALRRSVWQRNRLEPAVLGEDFQYQIKVQAEGLGVAFPEGAEVLHHHDYDVAGLWRRCAREGSALRSLGFPYGFGDALADTARRDVAMQWLRDVRHARLRSAAAVLFPVLRPMAVYAGSRFGKVPESVTKMENAA